MIRRPPRYTLAISSAASDVYKRQNPITWDTKKNSDFSNHKGLLFLNGKIFSNALRIYNIENGVFLKTPKIGLFKTLLISTLKDYHKADINLFWEDIRQNSVLRVKTYFKNLAE